MSYLPNFLRYERATGRAHPGGRRTQGTALAAALVALVLVAPTVLAAPGASAEKPGAVPATAPTVLNYQGRFTDDLGAALDAVRGCAAATEALQRAHGSEANPAPCRRAFACLRARLEDGR